MRKEIICLIGLALGLYILAAILFFSPINTSQLAYSNVQGEISGFNVTASLGYILRTYLGYTSIVFALSLFYWVFLRFFYEEEFSNFKFRFFSLILFLFSCSGLLVLIFSKNGNTGYSLGGLIGFFISDLTQRYFGRSGAFIILFTASLLSAIIVTDLPLLSYIFILLKKFFSLIKAILLKSRNSVYPRSAVGGISKRKREIVKEQFHSVKNELKPTEEKRFKEPIPQKIPIVLNKQVKPYSPKKDKAQSEIKPKVKEGYILPPIDLLELPPAQKDRELKEDLRANANILEDTLRDFGIEAKVVNIEKGPVVTRYELQPAPGVKVQWIASLSEDIGLVMKSYNVHVAPVSGKGTVGVEVPNTTTTVVYLREIIGSQAFQEHSSLLSLALGKKVSGESLVSDLGDMPHLLIAGTTGSGKTVCINALITSLLYKATPDEVRLILIDPKMVELACFNDLPHLVVPVITNSNAAISALEWAVNEMESRYKLLAKAGVRNIEIYNEKKDKDSELPGFLAYIVIIIDELADLMLVASKEIEGYIARLAQLSRAVGIHMILATQRPSVDVITGVIKANFPSRISFKVASKVDSRTVLDMNGADKLVGKGDMLFIPPGVAKPWRAQGTLVSDKEIEDIVKFLKDQREPQYDQSLLEADNKTSHLKSPGKRDAMYDEAVNVIMQSDQASVSILQRRLGVGYTRAARLIDMMEEDGIVGPYQGSKPREILIDREEYLRNSGVVEKGKQEDD